MPNFASLLPLAQAENHGMREFVDDLARTPLSRVVIFVAILTVVRVAVFPVLKNTPAHMRGGAYAAARILNELLDAFVYAGVFVFMLIRPFGVQAFLIPSGSMWPTLHVDDFIVANKAIYRYSDPKDNDVVVFKPPKEAATPDQLDAQGEVKVDFIKRCIGTPGQVIELRKGVLYRDGQRAVEDDQHKHFSECLQKPEPAECQEFGDLTPETVQSLTPVSFKLVKYKGQLIPLNYTDYDANSGFPRGNINETRGPYSIAAKYQIDDQNEAMKLTKLPPEPIPAGHYLFMGDNRNGSFDGRGWGLIPRDWIIGRAEFIWFPLTHLGRVR